MGEVVPPKKQAVIDRLRRRIEIYRRRQSECVPRFDQSFSGACEQQGLETTALQRRFLEGKAKRAAKKGDRRAPEPALPPQHAQHAHHALHAPITSNLHSSVHVQQKFLKRSAEDDGPGGGGGGGGGAGPSPPGKLQRPAAPSENLTKFSVEIVQQLEFTTSAADSQPQQISTNVTVKALTNASLKSESVPLIECKREPENDFADLDQLPNFPGFTDLIGDDVTLKDLMSDISDYQGFMKDFDFEDKDILNADGHGLLGNGQMKTEDGRCDSGASQPQGEQADGGAVGRGFAPRPGGYGGELSPAAQTLKQMAEQHQHKQLGMGARAARSPYAELHDYLTGPPAPFRKQEVKQEPAFAGSYKQYSPYGSPGSAGHGSPGYLPRGSFGGPSPPRPPSGPPSGPSPQSGLHINQAQHLHISHPSHAIQVSAGQHMHLSAEMQGGAHVSVAAHQGMYFGQPPNQHHQGAPSPHHQSGPGSGDTYTVSQSQTINFTQQSLRQRQQQQQAPMGANMSPGGPMPSMPMGNPGMPNNNMAANSMGGMGGMGMTREQHAKLMQQQQLMRQALQGAPHLRPPPPDYKAPGPGQAGQPGPGSGLGMQPGRFPPPVRRATHQPMPPSAGMMRAGVGGPVYGGGAVGSGLAGAGARYAAPGAPPDWRHHLAMQQHQQAANFARHPAAMPGFAHHPQHQGGFPMGGNSMQQQQQMHQQQQLLRSQQQMLPSHHQPLPPHLVAQQNQAISMQGQMSNIHMSQSQSISLHHNNGAGGGGGSFPSLHGSSGGSSGASGFPGQPPDFNLDFLENMQAGDSSEFTAQELLNSLDNDPGFNLQDIL